MNSKIIAEFLDWKIEKGMENLPDPYYNHSEGWGMVQVSDMQFHTSWDWLMPVVEKIEEYAFVIIGDFNNLQSQHYQFNNPTRCTIRDKRRTEMALPIACTTAETKLQSVYQAVTTFIEWYNQQPPHLTQAE